jgi:triosephosphate isomerase (TIM)
VPERLVVGNWKMNPPTISEAVALARAVASRSDGRVPTAVAPAAIALAAVADALRGTAVGVYAQDVHWEEAGAFTGQTSVTMLKGIAVGSIVGHSEMRRDQGDDDARVAKKAVRALGAGLRVVLCVGESEDEFARDLTDEVIERQTRAVIRPLKAAGHGEGLGRRLLIAYEPIWAIGTGRPATGAHATAAAAKIRNVLHDEGIAAEAVAVLYGGSVSASSVREFAHADGIGGALVGGASLKPDEFAAIVGAFA